MAAATERRGDSRKIHLAVRRATVADRAAFEVEQHEDGVRRFFAPTVADLARVSVTDRGDDGNATRKRDYFPVVLGDFEAFFHLRLDLFEGRTQPRGVGPAFVDA